MQSQTIPAIVVALQDDLNLPYEIKEITSIEKFPDDRFFLNFIKQVAYYHQVAPLLLIKRFRKFIEQKNENESSETIASHSNIDLIVNQLTEEQQNIANNTALEFLNKYLNSKNMPSVTLNEAMTQRQSTIY